ncbi:MAG: tetratricopeptide repeat protein, partial [Bacteroidota bacterium]
MTEKQDPHAGAFEQALAHHHAGDLRAACEGYYAILERDGNYALAHQNLIDIHLRSDAPTKALDHALTFVELQPEVPEAHHNLGVIYSQLEEPKSAAAAFERALTRNPEFVQAHLE